MKTPHPTLRRGLVALLALGLVVPACGSDDDTSASGSSDGTEEPTGDGGSDLASVCPNPMVVQTDWYPEPEHGGLYQLIGGGGTVDADAGTYTGEIGDTGVEMEIRVGGPYVGYQTVTSQLYADPGIFMGYVSTDEAIILSDEFPTVAVMAPLERSPQSLLYDPEQFPDLTWDTLADQDDATVLYFEGSSFMTFLLGAGLVEESQTDSSYDGSPNRFVSDDGIVQSGYATNDVFKYEHLIEEWGKPVDYLLVDDAGYRVYNSAMAVTPEVVSEESDCLEQLVPLMQQAQVDYITDPGEVNDALLGMVDELASTWVLSEELNEFAVAEMLELGVVGNGPDDTLGNFDTERVDDFVTEAVPYFESAGVDGVKEGVTAEDLVTNEFIDPEIGLD